MEEHHIGLMMAGGITVSQAIVAILAYECWPFVPISIRRYHALLVIPMTLIVLRRLLYLFRVNGIYSGIVFENLILMVVSFLLIAYFWLVYRAGVNR